LDCGLEKYSHVTHDEGYALVTGENRMEVDLTPNQKASVLQAIENGRLHREEDALQEVLPLWVGRERTRAENSDGS
jgi:hypothetical protein